MQADVTLEGHTAARGSRQRPAPTREDRGGRGGGHEHDCSFLFLFFN